MTALSKTGARMLAKAEDVIERGLSGFMEVGAALEQIRDGRLYRQDYETFEAYCRGRWDMSARRARQLMDAMEIGTIVPIANEAQGRELAGLDPEEVIEVYEAAQADGDVTAKSLATARDRKHPKIAGEGEPGVAEQEPAAPVANASAGRDVVPSSSVSDSEPEQAPPAPATVGGTEGYRAAATKARSMVRSHLLTLDPERVIATADEPDHWREFSADVRSWLDDIDSHLAGPRLKAVQG